MIGRRAAGSLEREVLAALWAADGAVTAAEVRIHLGGTVAHTTVNTILGRLHAKGAVSRKTGARGYRYEPVLDAAGLTARRMHALMAEGKDPAGVLHQFIAELDAAGLAALRRALEDPAAR